MRIALYITIACLMGVTTAAAADPWHPIDKTLLAIFVAGQVVSMGQLTDTFDGGWSENTEHIRWIHEQGGMSGLYAHKALSTAAVAAMANFLPVRWRRALLVGANSVIWNFVVSDAHVGVGFRF